MSKFKDSQFDYLFSAIADRHPAIAPRDSTTQFQFSGSPMSADWGSAPDIKARRFANSVPTDVNGFFSPGNAALDISYGDFLSALDSGIKPNKHPRYRELVVKNGDLMTEFGKNRDHAKIAYLNYCEKNKDEEGRPLKTFIEWFESPLGLEYKMREEDIIEERQRVRKEMREIEAATNAPLKRAKELYESDIYKTTYIKPDKKEEKLRTVSIGGDLSADVKKWKEAYGENDYDLDVTLNKDSLIKTPWKTEKRTEVESNCFSSSVKTTFSTERIIRDDHYSLQVRFKGIKSYPIKFGGWYSASLVNPSTANISSISGRKKEDFFGAENGSLHMIPSQIWVVFRPEAKLTISTKLYKQTIEAELKANLDWISIMSFRFSAKAGTSLAKIGEETTEISFKSPENQGPYILGVTSVKKIC